MEVAKWVTNSDLGQALMIGCGFILILGSLCAGAESAAYAAQGRWGEAAISSAGIAAGFVVGAGAAVGAAKVAAKLATRVAMAERAATAGRAGPKAITASARVNPWKASPVSRVSTEGEKMYRVYGGDAKKAGAWITPIRPSSSIEARQGLALPPENAVTQIAEVTLPAGVRMQTGGAASAFGQPGGWPQVELLERVPLSSFGDSVPLR